MTEAGADDVAVQTGVSVCIVNYNQRELLERCIQAVLRQDIKIPVELLIADNGSTDDSVAWLKGEHPEIPLIENDNLGFSRSNNQLIGQSRHSMVLLLNNDCVLEPDALRKMVEAMESDDKIGILGCRTLVADGILQPTFHSASRHAFFVRKPAKWDTAHVLMFGADLEKRRALMRKYESSHGYDRFREVPAISGVCLLIRRDVFRDVGLLDEAFFMYHEDTDFCLRARKAGWKVCYTPAAVVHHFLRRKETKRSPRLLAEAWFSQFYFVRKHFGRVWGGLLLARQCAQTAAYCVYGALLVAMGRESGREWRERLEWRWQTIVRSAGYRVDQATSQENA